MTELTVGSLFSGIGGLDLGLERAGMRVIWQSEIDPYANRVLKKHWPEVPNLGNIKEINWADVVRPDVLCGGYPCQPFSTAGKRRGEEDPRHLWPWVRDAISALRPRYAILENVRGHLTLGGSTVLGELADIGYDAEWRVVSAASVGANHRRDRIIIVAYPNDTGWQGRSRESEPQSHRLGAYEAEHGTTCANDSGIQSRENVAYPNGDGAPNGGQRQVVPGEGGSRGNDGGGSDRHPGQVSVRGPGEDPGDVAYANGQRLEGTRPKQQTTGFAGGGADVAYPNNAGRNEQRRPFTASAQNSSTKCGCTNMAYPKGGDGGKPQPHGLRTVYGQTTELGKQSRDGRPISSWWETEPDVGRVANGVPSRVDRLRGLGNAVVPQVAEVIGRLVVQHWKETNGI